jgi:hypothetical protein
MRVLVVAHGFPPRAEGGSEVYAHAHARTLRRLYGDEILVLAREDDPTRPDCAVRRDQHDGLNIAWINNTFRLARGFPDVYRNDALAGIAARLICDFEPDLAHLHHLTCLSTLIPEVLARQNIPCVYTLHD